MGLFIHQIFIECRAQRLSVWFYLLEATAPSSIFLFGEAVWWPDSVYTWLVTEIWLHT